MRNSLPEFEVIGTFDLPSGVVRVTDPCYDRATSCAGELKVKPGKWKGAVKRQDEGDWGVRIKEIIAFHESADEDKAVDASTDSGIDVGVDSGQAGFFADEMYPAAQHKEHGEGDFDYNNKESFYGRVCETTQTEASAGIVKEGIVASSGFGDGAYRCYTTSRDGEIVGMRIDFIPDNDPDQDYDDDLDEAEDEDGRE